MKKIALIVATLMVHASFSRGAVLIDLDATTLPTGLLSSWTNTGTLGGTFVAGTSQPDVQPKSKNTGGGNVNALILDGIDDWMVGPDAVGGVTGNLSRSVEVWVRNSSIADEETLISWSRRGGADASNFSFNYGSNTVSGAVSLTGGATWDTAWAVPNPTAGQWRHLVVTWNGTQLTIYDGATQKAQRTFVAGLSTATTYSGGANAKFVVGAQAQFDGSIPAVVPADSKFASIFLGRIKVHNAALTPAEIRASYNAVAPTFGMGLFVLPIPKVNYFTATPGHFVAGAPVTLSWSVDDATTVKIDGVTVAGGAPVGSLVVYPPSQHTTYTLTGSNSTGSITAKTIAVYTGTPVALKNRWSFDEIQGTTVIDSVSGADGTIKGSDWSRTDTKVVLNPAAATNGAASTTSAYIDLPNLVLSSKIGDVTIEGWYSQSGSQTNAKVFDFGNSSGGEFYNPGGSGTGSEYLSLSAQYADSANQATNTISKFLEMKTAAATNSQIFASQPFTLSTDYHFAVVYDVDGNAGNPQLRYYHNGVLVSPNIATNNRIAEMLDVNCFLGRSNTTTDINLQGAFNEFRIWQGTLSDSQIQASYAGGPNAVVDPTDQPVTITVQPGNKRVGPGQMAQLSVTAEGTQPMTYQWYRNGNIIPGATGRALYFKPATIVDSGDSFHCVVSNNSPTAGLTTVTSAAGILTVDPLQHRYSFTANLNDSLGGANATGVSNTNGAKPTAAATSVTLSTTTQQYLDLPVNKLAIRDYQALTMESWVTYGATLGNNAKVFDFGHQASSLGQTEVYFTPHISGGGSSRMAFSYLNPTANTELTITRTGQLDGLAAAHVVCVYDPPNNQMKLYINGVLEGTTNMGGKTLSELNITKGWIGRSLTTSDSFLAGTLDEVRIYATALSASEVSANFAAGPNTLVTPTFAITKQPQSLNVNEGVTANFTVELVGVPPIDVQWYKDGNPIPGANATTYSIATVPALTNSTYYAVATSGANVLTSNTATLTVVADLSPPTIVSAEASSLSTVSLLFSEPVTTVSATNLANFSMTGGITLSSPVLSSDGRTLTFNVSPNLLWDSSYTMTINNVVDRAVAANMIAANTQRTIVPFTLGPVGTLGVPPSVTSSPNGGYCISGGGAGPLATTDQMAFASGNRTGDFDLRVRVSEFAGARPWAQAGLMARQSTATNVPFAAGIVTPTSAGSFFSYRTTTAGSVASVGSFPAAYPNAWVRLKRQTNTFTAYASTDGTSWQTLGSQTISMPTTILVGPFVSGGGSTLYNSACFNDFGTVVGGTTSFNVKTPIEPIGPSSRRGAIVVSEFSYNPSPANGGGNLEFVELLNTGPVPMVLTGWKLSGGIDYAFPANTTMQPGAYLVVAGDPTNLQATHGITGVLGPWTGNLSNEGELFRVENNAEGTMFEVEYGLSDGWPVAANGLGHTLCLTRPSYGEMDPRAWSASSFMGGGPGKFNPFSQIAQHAVKINEIRTNSVLPEEDFVELFNTSSAAMDIGGCTIGSGGDIYTGYIFPTPTLIPARGYLSLTRTQLGFSLASEGERLWLSHPDNGILDAITYGGQDVNVSQNRDGRELATPTPGSANSGFKSRPIVINEIMYNPISGDSGDEFIELYNKSASPVILTGWKLTGAVDFTFGSDTIAPGGFLVVAKNQAQLLTRGYASLNAGNTRGDYSGSLSNSGESVRLTMPVQFDDENGLGSAPVEVNRVDYKTGGRWGRYADGGGSSLELVDPRADNRLAGNWDDSDESSKAVWDTFTVTALHDYRAIRDANRIELFLQGIGECLVDDISIKNTSNVNFVTNGGFESGMGTGTFLWTSQGTQANTILATSGAATGANCLRVRSSDRGDTGANRVRNALSTDGTNVATLLDSTSYTFAAKAKWVRGSRRLHLRVSGNGLELPILLKIPTNLGSPGATNSKAAPNIGPAISEVAHYPVLPAAGEAVLVTARIADPDNMGTVNLQYRNDTDNGTTQTVAMNDTGAGQDAFAGDGIYSGTIPGQSSGKMIAFKIVATDAAAPALSTTFPKPNPLIFPTNLQAVDCYVNFGETQQYGTLGTYRIWISKATDSAWSSREKNSNSPLDCTFVAGNYRAMYNVTTLYSGSPFHSPGFGGPISTNPDFEVEFPADDMFLGANNFVLQDQDGDATLMAEIVSNWIGTNIGAIANHKRTVHVYVNGGHKGIIYEDSQQPNGDMVKQYQRDYSEGVLHKIEDWFEFDDAGSGFGNVDATLPTTSTTINGVSGQKKMARYRWNWRVRANEDPNAYGPLYELIDVMNASANDTTYVQNIEAKVDIRKWFGGILTHHIAGDWDSYGYARGKNAFAYKGINGKWVQMLWDIDFALGAGSHGASTNIFETSHPEVATMFNNNAFRRFYLGMALEAANGPLTAANYNPPIDARYLDFRYNNISASDPAGQVKTYLNDRRTYILSQVPSASFTATAGTTSTNVLNINGTAPVNVRKILVNGIEYPVTWTTITNWTVAFPRVSGLNTIIVTGLDANGTIIFTAPTITSTFSGTVTWTAAKINEWVADNTTGAVDPADGKREDWFEIYNPSGTTLNLAGWFLTDTIAYPNLFLVPSGVSIPAGGFLRVWADNEVAQTTTGNLHVNFKLTSSGDLIRLAAPDGTLIDMVAFGPQFANRSEGRYPNGSVVWPLTEPTPGASNILVQLSIQKLGNANPGLTFNTVIGRTYKLWASDNLLTWSVLGTYVANSTTLTVPDPAAAGLSRRFYRTELVPLGQ